MPSLLQQMFRRKPVLEMEAESGSKTGQPSTLRRFWPGRRSAVFAWVTNR
jgi:hypothetical protein